MDKLDVKPTSIPRAEIRNTEQAKNWIGELVREMLEWRCKCDVIVPDKTDAAILEQKRANYVFLTKQGRVTGALMTLKLCGLIDDRFYAEMKQKATNTLIPTVVGGFHQ